MLTRSDQDRLLRLARRALEARVLGTVTADTLDGCDEIHVASGAFVSIHRQGMLRGCLGRLEPLPLATVVDQLARAVADSDPRFAAVTAGELPEIHIEISVLTPEREIESPSEIRVGRHGLIVQLNMRRGLLLPQVATERGWDRITFLDHACLKAGLPRGAWKDGARVFVFEALVFREGAPEN